MIVIDASSLAKYILKEENWIKVEEYLLREVCSIDHIVKEVVNSIWKHIVIFRRFSLEEGKTAYQLLNKIIDEGLILIEDERNYIDEALDIAIKNLITIYDSLYIAQALKYGELLTSDSKQAGVARKLGVKVHYIK